MNGPKILLAVCLLATLSCGSLQRRDQIGNTSGKSSSTTKGESPFDEVQAPPPAPISKTPKVGVILGPGAIKTFAHIGVLKELVRAQIPIDAIIGLEWGALMAAVYAQKGLAHEVEWKLYKLQEKDFKPRGFFANRNETVSVGSLAGFFKENLSGRGTKVPFSCPSLSLGSGILTWQTGNDLQVAMEKCLPAPPLLKPTGPWTASLFAVSEAVERLKAQGMELIIFVNVLNSGELWEEAQLLNQAPSAILWQEAKRAMLHSPQMVSEFIDVPTRLYDLVNFENRRALVTAGEQAGHEAADRIAVKYRF